MRYTRKMLQSPPIGAPKGTEWVHFYEIFEQPLKDRLAYKVYKVWWYASWKVKPISWVIDHVADPIAERVHARHCDNDCGMSWRPGEEDKKKPTCTRIPVDAALDCKLFDLDRRNNKLLASTRP